LWGDVLAMLADGGKSSADFTIGIALLCDALADWQAASKAAEDAPAVDVDERGNRRASPEHRVKRAAFDRVAKACREFGLTPATALANAGIDGPDDGDFFDGGRIA
jgi:hypothetical protein